MAREIGVRDRSSGVPSNAMLTHQPSRREPSQNGPSLEHLEPSYLSIGGAQSFFMMIGGLIFITLNRHVILKPPKDDDEADHRVDRCDDKVDGGRPGPMVRESSVGAANPLHGI